MNKDDRRSGIAGKSGGLRAFFPALNKEDDERGGKHGCGCKEDPTLCVNAFELFKQHKFDFFTIEQHKKVSFLKINAPANGAEACKHKFSHRFPTQVLP